MAQPKILALILAGGAGSRMDVLTDVRAKPALPFAGVYRLIDIPLSNCVHSAISDVWVAEQFQPQSLNDHLLNGRPWDLDRTYGGLRIMPPFQGTRESGWHRGNADAIYRNSRFIREAAPDLLLVLSADHVYKYDYRQAVTAHLEQQADVTMVTTDVPLEEASRFGTVQVSNNGQVTNFEYKADAPQSATATTEIFVYTTATLLDVLDELAQQGADEQDAPLKDFGDELLPRLVEQGRAYAVPLDGYWRDVGTVSAYWKAHMDFLSDEPALRLDDPHWPLRSAHIPRLPAHIHASASIDNSLIAPGCDIRGRVVRSVIGPGVVVEAGALIEDSVVFQDVRVGSGARVAATIIDSEADIASDAQVGGSLESAHSVGEERLVVIGKRAHVPANVPIRAGQRIKAGATPQAIQRGDTVKQVDAQD